MYVCMEKLLFAWLKARHSAKNVLSDCREPCTETTRSSSSAMTITTEREAKKAAFMIVFVCRRVGFLSAALFLAEKCFRASNSRSFSIIENSFVISSEARCIRIFAPPFQSRHTCKFCLHATGRDQNKSSQSSGKLLD